MTKEGQDGTGRNAVFSKTAYPNGDGDVAGLVGNNSDITDHKRAENTVRELSRFLNIVIDNANIWIDVLDEKGNVLIWNKAAEAISGYSRAEVVGHSEKWAWMYPDEAYRKEVFEKVAATIQGGGAIEDLETVIRAKGGEDKIISWRVRSLVDEKGAHIGAVALGRDVTEHKQFEKEMARLERMNLVGEMAAGIAHEIRNPMTTVRGFLQLLGEKEGSTKYKHYFDLMIEELDRADSIITEFLLLAGKKTAVTRSEDLNSIIAALLPLIQADAVSNDKYVNVELGAIPKLVLDAKEIRQMILNLSRNGLEAMSAGGTLNIKTFAEGEDVVLSVRDQGKGIKPELLDKLGTPFLTTKDRGTGLGLAVCYSIAARHGAIPEVETGSTGTTFFIRFQAATGSTSPP
ncbi:MAG: PAS domain S-box protein [Candidatus Desulforudis sp.]|nr:PAS domain S-box protein [Desulforudis sp.]